MGFKSFYIVTALVASAIAQESSNPFILSRARRSPQYYGGAQGSIAGGGGNQGRPLYFEGQGRPGRFDFHFNGPQQYNSQGFYPGNNGIGYFGSGSGGGDSNGWTLEKPNSWGRTPESSGNGWGWTSEKPGNGWGRTTEKPNNGWGWKPEKPEEEIRKPIQEGIFIWFPIPKRRHLVLPPLGLDLFHRLQHQRQQQQYVEITDFHHTHFIPPNPPQPVYLQEIRIPQFIPHEAVVIPYEAPNVPPVMPLPYLESSPPLIPILYPNPSSEVVPIIPAPSDNLMPLPAPEYPPPCFETHSENHEPREMQWHLWAHGKQIISPEVIRRLKYSTEDYSSEDLFIPSDFYRPPTVLQESTGRGWRRASNVPKKFRRPRRPALVREKKIAHLEHERSSLL